MKRYALLVLLILSVCSQAWGLEIRAAVMTTGVEDRTPVDNVEAFPAADSQLYCFTHIVGAEGETEVVHEWYWGEKMMVRAVLPVRSPSWRTWSTKKFEPEWLGDWRVDIRDTAGTLLQTLTFTLI